MFKKLIIWGGVVLLCLLVPFIGFEQSTFYEGTFSQTSDIYLKPLPYINVKPACSCITFLQNIGVNIKGDAYRVKPNTDHPVEGGVVLLREGEYGHAAYILKIDFDSLIIVESNYSRCKITYRRIPLDYPLIRGYYIK